MAVLRVIAIALTIITQVSCVMESTKPSMIESKSKFEKIEIDSDVEDDFNAALSHLKAEEYDEAIQLLEKVIAVEYRVPAPFINLGMAYSKKGDDVSAEKHLLSAVEVELTNPVANNQLGLLYRKKGRFDDAKKAYTNALTEYPDYLPVVKNLGILCELYMRDFPCALKQYEHYLSLQPDDKTMKIWISDLSRRIK
ncbi:MAG: tetratricopeptide repeat protein [Gammaproteobacteria bacterium]|nr:tetratricopeptide repeat protein [Gammaproteobacteria bacterium]